MRVSRGDALFTFFTIMTSSRIHKFMAKYPPGKQQRVDADNIDWYWGELCIACYSCSGLMVELEWNGCYTVVNCYISTCLIMKGSCDEKRNKTLESSILINLANENSHCLKHHSACVMWPSFNEPRSCLTSSVASVELPWCKKCALTSTLSWLHTTLLFRYGF